MTISSYDDAQRIKRLRNVLNELDLSMKHLDAILDSDFNSSAFLPYHNAQHLITVALHAYDAGRYYFGHRKDGKNSIGNLVLAGLYHDVNHSGGRYSDSVNVARAVTTMIAYVSEIESVDVFGSARLNKIADLICATEFPHRGVYDSLSCKIIRDADLCQYLEPDINYWIDALAKETRSTVTLSSTRVFLSEQKFNTRFFSDRFQRAGLI